VFRRVRYPQRLVLYIRKLLRVNNFNDYIRLLDIDVIYRYYRLTVQLDIKLSDTALHRIIPTHALPQLLSELLLRLRRETVRIHIVPINCDCLLAVYDFKALLRAHIGVEDVHLLLLGAADNEFVSDFTTGTVELPGFTTFRGGWWVWGVVFWGLGEFGVCRFVKA
jgi:hypothetical protein